MYIYVNKKRIDEYFIGGHCTVFFSFVIYRHYKNILYALYIKHLLNKLHICTYSCGHKNFSGTELDSKI